MTIHSELHPLDKWISGISEHASVQEAASYSLRDRLASLQQFFPRAAISKADSVEDVHQLRVATRRVLGVLDLYSQWLPTKPAKSLRRSLKKILRASGAVRDLDVLTKRYQKVEHKNAVRLVKALNRRRSRKLLRLVKLYLRQKRGDRLSNQTERLLTKLETSKTPTEAAAAWMKSRWSQLVEQFYQSAEVDTEDLDALHRLRIRSKQLRYALELLAPVFPPEPRANAYEFVEGLQDRLGRLHDHDIARNMFCDWDSQQNRISKACNLKLLMEREKKLLQKERLDLVAWWTPTRISAMRHAFERLTALDPHVS